MTIEHVTDYEEHGPEQLIERYRKPTVVALLASWLSEVQEVEDALWALLTERAAGTAVGAQLDLLGRIVGQPREGRPDHVYQVWVAARILVLRSAGKPEQLIAIAKKLVGAHVPIRIEEHSPQAVMLYAEAAIDPALGVQVAKLLSAAKGGGVTLHFVWFSSLAGEPFRFASGLESVLDSPVGLDHGVLAAISKGNDVEFATPVASGVPSDALLNDSDNQPLTFDGDNDFLTLG